LNSRYSLEGKIPVLAEPIHDQALAERSHLLTHTAMLMFKRLAEANNEFFALLWFDRTLADNRHYDLGRNQGIFAQDREIVVAEAAFLFFLTGMRYLARGKFLFHVRQNGDTVLYGAFLYVFWSHLPFHFNLRVVARLVGIRLQDQYG